MDGLQKTPWSVVSSCGKKKCYHFSVRNDSAQRTRPLNFLKARAVRASSLLNLLVGSAPPRALHALPKNKITQKKKKNEKSNSRTTKDAIDNVVQRKVEPSDLVLVLARHFEALAPRRRRPVEDVDVDDEDVVNVEPERRRNRFLAVGPVGPGLELVEIDLIAAASFSNGLNRKRRRRKKKKGKKD